MSFFTCLEGTFFQLITYLHSYSSLNPVYLSVLQEALPLCKLDWVLLVSVTILCNCPHEILVVYLCFNIFTFKLYTPTCKVHKGTYNCNVYLYFLKKNVCFNEYVNEQISEVYSPKEKKRNNTVFNVSFCIDDRQQLTLAHFL
jgi:hypothetical protein